MQARVLNLVSTDWSFNCINDSLVWRESLKREAAVALPALDTTSSKNRPRFYWARSSRDQAKTTAATKSNRILVETPSSFCLHTAKTLGNQTSEMQIIVGKTTDSQHSASLGASSLQSNTEIRQFIGLLVLSLLWRGIYCIPAVNRSRSEAGR